MLKNKNRVLSLVTDAYGGYGGISVYNQDMLNALSKCNNIDKITSIGYSKKNNHYKIPNNVSYLVGNNSKIGYILRLMRATVSPNKTDIIICSHIHLLPLAYFAKCITKAPIVLLIFGIEIWEKPRVNFINFFLRRVNKVISISNFTTNKFVSWSGFLRNDIFLLNNACHIGEYGICKKSASLEKKFNLFNKKVILTFGRIVSKERAKGFDEVIEAMPELVKIDPDIVYLVAGEGDYRKDLKCKVKKLGIIDNVVFTGMVQPEQKNEIYNLADVYVMPSKGEGFGFVFLEAMACGLPVVASRVDGGYEAIMQGNIGIAVDPDNREELIDAILKSLKKEKKIPPELKYFSFNSFSKKLCSFLKKIKDDIN